MNWERFTRVSRLVASIAIGVGAIGTGATACSDATGSVSGGTPLFDAAINEPNSASDASSCGDLTRDAGSGTGWSDLYRDYFGPQGQASCSSGSTCHGDPTQKGAMSGDFVCGADADSCYAGITSPKAGLVSIGDKTTDPKSTSLYAVLRKKCGSGSMPDEPKFAFDAADMQRIVAWIHAGASKN